MAPTTVESKERALSMTDVSTLALILTQIARGNSCRQGTDARLRCLAAQAAASAMSKANEAINPIGIPEVTGVAVCFPLFSPFIRSPSDDVLQQEYIYVYVT